MSKNHIASNKISGNHSTLINEAVVLVKAAVKIKEVRRVTPGFIQAGISSLRKYPASIKFTSGENYLKILVRGKSSVQEVHIYTSDVQNVIVLLSKIAEEGEYLQIINKK